VLLTAKIFHGVRFHQSLYEGFRRVCNADGYTVNGAFEQFMQSCIEADALVFAESGTAGFETEARVLADWLSKGKFFYRAFSGEELTVAGRLLELLPKIHDAALRGQIEDELKKSVPKQ
jgi:hypothetical protein